MNHINKKLFAQILMSIFGTFLFSVAINIIIVPLGLYNGGFMGISQLIRTFLIEYLPLPVPKGFDIAGLIYFMINIPLFFLAYKEMGKIFFNRTVIVVISQTIFLSLLIPPSSPVISDMLTACIIGGILAGIGSGLVLRSSSSSGGQDIIGIYCTRKYPNFSVGKVAIGINLIVYGICALLFDFEIVIYSLIYTTFLALFLDKVHYQNINMSVMIFTKKPDLDKLIMTEMHRGVTTWEGSGAYTKEHTQILVVCISKYETNKLRRVVLGADPGAFIIVNEGVSISSNFEKRL